MFKSIVPTSVCTPYSEWENPGKIIPVLENYLEGIRLYMEKETINKELINLKEIELFILLVLFYSKEELQKLLTPVFIEMNPFRNLILYNSQAESVEELMSLTGMKRRTFEKVFRKEFKTSPHQWLLLQKMEVVKNALKDSHLNLKEVRKNLKFNSDTDFIRFCHRQFGKKPSELRKILQQENE